VDGGEHHAGGGGKGNQRKSHHWRTLGALKAPRKAPRRWFPTEEIGWSRTQEIRWYSTEETGWSPTEEIAHVSMYPCCRVTVAALHPAEHWVNGGNYQLQLLRLVEATRCVARPPHFSIAFLPWGCSRYATLPVEAHFRFNDQCLDSAEDHLDGRSVSGQTLALPTAP
jgi:hypothetical protein